MRHSTILTIFTILCHCLYGRCFLLFRDLSPFKKYSNNYQTSYEPRPAEYSLGSFDDLKSYLNPTKPYTKPTTENNEYTPTKPVEPNYEVPYASSTGTTYGNLGIPYQPVSINPLTHLLEAGNQYLQKLSSIFENPKLVKDLLLRSQSVAHSIDTISKQNDNLIQDIDKLNILMCPPGAKQYGDKCLQLFENKVHTYHTARDFCVKKGGDIPTTTLKNITEVLEALDVHESALMSIYWGVKTCDLTYGVTGTAKCISTNDEEIEVDDRVKKIVLDGGGCARLGLTYGQYTLTSVSCSGDTYHSAGTACVACQFDQKKTPYVTY